MIKKESEFKSGKLGLVVDSLDLINLPYPLRSDLTSSIIDAWSLEISEKGLKQRKHELHTLLNRIKNTKSDLKKGYAYEDSSIEERYGFRFYPTFP